MVPLIKELLCQSPFSEGVKYLSENKSNIISGRDTCGIKQTPNHLVFKILPRVKYKAETE
jgi:hypothetical protein